MSKKQKSKHLLLNPSEVEFSRKIFQWAEIWHTDEATTEESNKVYTEFLRNNKKVKIILNPFSARRLLSAYAEFCEAVKAIPEAVRKNLEVEEELRKFLEKKDE